MTKLSINLNKFALVRNSRGNNNPDLIDIANKCIKYGVDGITVHPRPDERHTKISDLNPLKELVSNFSKVELNIEGFPNDDFVKNVIRIKPDQVTLVPDPPNALTSSFGWDCKKNEKFLKKIVNIFQDNNIRVSIFINPSLTNLSYLKDIMPNRVELYTYDYAHSYSNDKKLAIRPYLNVVKFFEENFPNIDLNAGHDLNLINLNFFLLQIPAIKEVSIGHSIICDTFEYGLKLTIEKYLQIIK